MNDAVRKAEQWLAGCEKSGPTAELIRELVEEVKKKSDYAERMDALAEERQIRITELEGPPR